MADKYQETILDTNSFLTNLVTSYKLSEPVADFISPPFQVRLEAGKYASFNKSLNRIWDDLITGSEEAKEIQWDVDENSYACEEYSMAKFVSDKKKNNSIAPINLDITAVQMLKRFHALAREYRVYQIAGNASVVTQTTGLGGDWDTVATGTPVGDILAGMGTVVANTGGYKPNRIVIPLQVALAMITTTEWLTYFAYTSNGFTGGLFDAVAGLRHLGLEPMVTSLMGANNFKSASDPTDEAIWSDSVVMFYCEPTPNLECRTFMYSPYTAKDQIFTTRMPRRRGVYHDIYSDIDELLIDAQCAYLFTNAL
jgi:hypothetical protein